VCSTSSSPSRLSPTRVKPRLMSNRYQHTKLTIWSAQTASEEMPECHEKHTIADDPLSSCSAFGTLLTISLMQQSSSFGG